MEARLVPNFIAASSLESPLIFLQEKGDLLRAQEIPLSQCSEAGAPNSQGWTIRKSRNLGIRVASAPI